MLSAVPFYMWILVALAIVVLSYRYILRMFGIVIIAEDEIGVLNKKFVIFGSNCTMPDGAIIATKGEAGWQVDTLAPGLHFFLWPWQYAVKKEKFVTIPDGNVGVVEARDGRALEGSGRVLGKSVECNAFQNARQFLSSGGERGPQLMVLTPGTYRINTALFSWHTASAKEISNDKVGVVVVKDGKPLRTGEIAGAEIAGHNSFQNGQAFIDGGGFRGRQEQVLLAGRYYLNPLFAEVEEQPMQMVPIAHVGVVIAYVGDEGVDVTGDSFKHGNLVKRGQKGVWIDPLDPGKYPINPYTHKVEPVPTANVVLNWANDKSEAHKLDERLSSITVRSSDGFKYPMDVSQIIHIPRADAPKVIARFGNVANLVTQVLEPTIGNYFRNAAQKSDVIAFLSERQQRQSEAKRSIEEALREYNVVAVDTLIGDIIPPESLMKTLTDRKIADQERVTFETQKKAEEVRQNFQEAKALADTQATIVSAQRSVQAAEFAAQAAVKAAEGQAKSKTLVAEADAMVTRTVGQAEADKILAVGTSEADVVKMKVSSMQSGNYASVEIARAFSTNHMKLVPDIVASGNGDGGGSLMNLFLATMLREEVKKTQGEKEEPTT